jgi:hypothetical protein
LVNTVLVTALGIEWESLIVRVSKKYALAGEYGMQIAANILKRSCEALPYRPRVIQGYETLPAQYLKAPGIYAYIRL